MKKCTIMFVDLSYEDMSTNIHYEDSIKIIKSAFRFGIL